jgi:prepilin-type N-terminal cleavage/methylation domain-containing protein
MEKKRWISGFTLLEVLLAVVIFSLVIGAVYSTFRAGLLMYRIGNQEKQIFQEARLLQNFTQRDLRSILAIEETYYDIPPIQQDTTSDIDYSSDTSWVPEESSYSVAPYPFIGTVSTMSFYSFAEVPLSTVRGLREGIFHIDYAYKDTTLFRNADEITGGIQEEEDMVHNILSCEFNYGFGKEEKWYWVENWDSRRDLNRTPKSDEAWDSLFDIERKNAVRVYPDNLPDAIRVRMILKDPGNARSEGREFEWVCDIPATKPTVKP